MVEGNFYAGAAKRSPRRSSLLYSFSAKIDLVEARQIGSYFHRDLPHKWWGSSLFVSAAQWKNNIILGNDASRFILTIPFSVMIRFQSPGLTVF